MSRKPHGVAPLGPVEKGIVARMKEADAKTYLVLCAHADRHTWEAYPGVARMADLAGLTERAVEVALSRLRGLGAITTARGGGRQRKSVHRLLSNPEPPCALSAAETPNHNAPFASENPEPRRRKPRTVARETPNHGAQEQKEEQTTENRKPRRAADRPPPDPRVKVFIDWFCADYQEAKGQAYIVAGGKDGATVKRLLAALDRDRAVVCGLAELKRAALAMLNDEKWGRDNASVGVLSAQINKWRGNGRGKGAKAHDYARGF
ncbi:MAG: hypothetical protein BWZ02_03121 [Lentisphaerae bacterium ADurb.BinA184]|nr:MAG: hypothetical protein BWZ02_03121 [Lentisphaerae bacterium ADurb.BinA184]